MITGCSHPGIVSIVKRAKDKFRRDVYMVIRGLHLLRHSDEEVKSVIRELKALGVKRIGPTHCTGEKAIALFRDAFGKGFIEMGVGRSLSVPWKQEDSCRKEKS